MPGYLRVDPVMIAPVASRYHRAMRLDFVKMHGLGNDFIVFDAADPAAIPTAAQLEALGDRRTGIGFDQALVLCPARRPDTLAYYRGFNAHSREVEQCGNGARCLAALLARRLQLGPGQLMLEN